MNRRTSVAAIIVLLLVMVGCSSAPTLVPETNSTVRGEWPSAETTVEGITVTATTGNWRWAPTDLDSFVTPVLIELENNSDRPLRIRFKDIRMLGDRGVYLAALPPYQVRGTTTRTVESPAYGYSGFYVASHVHPYYPHHPRSRHHYYHDNFYYYRGYHPVYYTYTIDLPTMEMLRRALPEGALEPGGRATGFVYFQRFNRQMAKKTGHLDLLFQIVDAETQEDRGVASLRFISKRR